MQPLPDLSSLAPFLLPYLAFVIAAVSATLAFTMAEALMSSSANRRQMPGALWASVLLVLLAGLGLTLAFRGMSAHLAAAGPPSGTRFTGDVDALDRLLALVGEPPPYGWR